MEHQELLASLQALADPSLEKFQKKVVADTHYPMYCIRMPALRSLARAWAKGNWQRLFSQAKWESYEEVLVLGLVVAYAKGEFSSKVPYLQQILPHMDSWAHTDSIVPTLKIKEADREAAWAFTQECLQSDAEYTIRFGVILLMDYFLEDRLSETLALLQEIRDTGYYVRMAVAWCLAETAVKHLQPVLDILQAGTLDLFTHNKTIQKMRESYRIDADTKAALVLLKRKEREI